MISRRYLHRQILGRYVARSDKTENLAGGRTSAVAEIRHRVQHADHEFRIRRSYHAAVQFRDSQEYLREKKTIKQTRPLTSACFKSYRD